MTIAAGATGASIAGAVAVIGWGTDQAGAREPLVDEICRAVRRGVVDHNDFNPRVVKSEQRLQAALNMCRGIIADHDHRGAW